MKDDLQKKNDSQKKNTRPRSRSRRKVLKDAVKEQQDIQQKNKDGLFADQAASDGTKSANMPLERTGHKNVQDQNSKNRTAQGKKQPVSKKDTGKNDEKNQNQPKISAEDTQVKKTDIKNQADSKNNEAQTANKNRQAPVPLNASTQDIVSEIQDNLRNEIKKENRSRALKKEKEYKPKKKSKLLKVVLMVIAEALVLGVIFSYAYMLDKYSRIQRPEFNKSNVVNNDLSVENIKRMEGYRNIAIFGVDTRDNSVTRGNSDVIIIASINQANGEIKMVSVFRDTYMNTGNDKYNKINNAYAVGGPEQALKAINKNLDLNITEYVTFSWKAVATGINILGGVDLEITKAEHRYINSYITETVKSTKIGSVQIPAPGMHHLDGIQAVAYGRLRYMDSDFARTERQRKIITLALEKAKNSDLKTLNDLLGNMLEMVATNLTWQDGLDVISDVKMYHIGETAGFPFARGGGNIGRKGDCVIPQTLESNVRQLHKFLFETEDYEPSETVKSISRRISSDSGMYKEGKYIDHVPTDKGYVPDEGERSGSGSSKSGGSGGSNSGNSSGSDGGSSGSKSSTKKSSEYGVDYETDNNGETKWFKKPSDESKSSENKNNSSSTDIYGPGVDDPTKDTGNRLDSTSDEYIGPGEQSPEKKPHESSAKGINPGSESTSERKPSSEYTNPAESTAERKPAKTNESTSEKKPAQGGETKSSKKASGEETIAPAPN